MSKGINGLGLAAASTGVLFLWSAVKGAAVTETLRELIKGQPPAGTNVYPITAPPPMEGTGVGGTGGAFVGTGAAADMIKAAASKRGQPYGFGAGHGGDPCKSDKTDCSSYVSCVINMATGSHINMATGGLAGYGVGIPYSQRMPGDIIVWNGGTGGGHTGVILSVTGNGGTMWHQPCTACGGVQIGRYPTGSRTAATAVVRRVTRR